MKLRLTIVVEHVSRDGEIYTLTNRERIWRISPTARLRTDQWRPLNICTPDDQ